MVLIHFPIFMALRFIIRSKSSVFPCHDNVFRIWIVILNVVRWEHRSSPNGVPSVFVRTGNVCTLGIEIIRIWRNCYRCRAIHLDLYHERSCVFLCLVRTIAHIVHARAGKVRCCFPGQIEVVLENLISLVSISICHLIRQTGGDGIHWSGSFQIHCERVSIGTDVMRCVRITVRTIRSFEEGHFRW